MEMALDVLATWEWFFMSIKAAFQFMQAVRQDENLKARIRRLGHPLSGKELVQIGRDAGFDGARCR